MSNNLLPLDQIKFRPAEIGDVNFILNSFLKSHRTATDDNKRMSNDVYYNIVKQKVVEIIGSNSILVACNAADPEQIFGWVCYRLDVVPVFHYIYVKYTWRKLGLARLLLSTVYSDIKKEAVIHTIASKVTDDNKIKYLLKYDPSFVTKKELKNEN